LLSGPRVFICDSCVRDCIALAIGTAAAEASTGVTRIVQAAGSLALVTCSFCGDRELSKMKLVRHDSELEVIKVICANCVGLCIEMLADYLGGEWTERLKMWSETDGP
jgi:ATP-dependent protease Clp ATPase subunit